MYVPNFITIHSLTVTTIYSKPQILMSKVQYVKSRENKQGSTDDIMLTRPRWRDNIPPDRAGWCGQGKKVWHLLLELLLPRPDP